MIKAVNAFQCEDGSLHLTNEEAYSHEFATLLTNEFKGFVDPADGYMNTLAEKMAVRAVEVIGRYGIKISSICTTLQNEILDILRTGNKISAIKRYREVTHEGLKEAKDAVERMGVQHGILIARTDSFGHTTYRFPHDQF